MTDWAALDWKSARSKAQGGSMESGEFFDNSSGGHAQKRVRESMWVNRKAYRRYSRWMDKQLAELVTRWAHLAAPRAQRFFRPIRPRTKT